MKPTVYLSGPIRKVDDDGRTWRDEMIEDFGDKFNFKNPLDRYDPSEVEIVNNPNNIGNVTDDMVLPSEYVFEDKMDIMKSDAMFVGLGDEVARGTSMECMFAYTIGKPYFLWPREGQEESGWMYDHATAWSVHRDFIVEEMEEYLKRF